MFLVKPPDLAKSVVQGFLSFWGLTSSSDACKVLGTAMLSGKAGVWQNRASRGPNAGLESVGYLRANP
jgi:hypothetical protein